MAALYHVAGWSAPYEWPSVPKLLGVTGGVSLMVGTAGQFWLSLRRHPLHGEAAQQRMDRAFILLLFLASASGLASYVARAGSWPAPVLVLHLAVVMALFITLPYGKFVHGIFRAVALLKWSAERRMPNRLMLGD